MPWHITLAINLAILNDNEKIYFGPAKPSLGGARHQAVLIRLAKNLLRLFQVFFCIPTGDVVYKDITGVRTARKAVSEPLEGLGGMP